MPDLEGDLDLAGTDRFELLRRLGAGGMGVVYEARDRELGDRIAIKTLRRLEPEALLRFKNEFRALQGLSHPNLVHLGELIEADGQWLLTMELVEGVDFLEHVRGGGSGLAMDSTAVIAARSSTAPVDVGELATGAAGHIDPTPLPGRCDPDRLREALIQLAHGLIALHDAGKTHRDVKPSNVLVTDDDRLVLLDFGLVTARGERSDRRDRELIGTPAYMAPEQTTGEPASPASDWYAVGVMTYQALTGRLPHTGTVSQVITAKHRVYPPRPEELVGTAPRELADLCMALLRREPEVRPDGRELLARLGVTTARGSTSRDLSLIGRERELATLDDALARAAPGAPVVVRVAGRSGMGKSALVDRFVSRARVDDDTLVLVGRCYQRESLPYKAIDSLVDDLARYLRGLGEGAARLAPPDPLPLVRVFPVLRGLPGFDRADADESLEPHELRRRMFAAFKRMVAGVAADRRLVIWLDDLQWGDLDSALLLAELVRPPRPPRLLLCASYRSEDAELSPMLRALDRLVAGGEVVDLPVGPLGAGESRTMARRLLGDASRVDAVVREADGVPFFIGELAQYYADAGDRARDVTIADVVGARVARLEPGAAAVLAAVAAFGRPIGRRLAASSAGVTDPATAFSLLTSARLIRSAGIGEQVETYHDRIRDAVLAGLPAERRRQLLGELARRVADGDAADPEILADLWDGAGDAERAADYYEAAAVAADQRLAFSQAARLYQRAVEVGDRDDADRLRLTAARAVALANAGHTAEAAETHLAAAALAEGDSADRHRLRAGALYCLATLRDEGLDVLRGVLPAYGIRLPESDRRALWSLLWNRAAVRSGGIDLAADDRVEAEAATAARFDVCWEVATGLSTVDPVRSAALYARATRIARRSRDPRQVALALAGEVTVSAIGGTLSRRATEIRLARARAAADRVGDPYVDGYFGFIDGTASYLRGDFARAVTPLQRAGELLRRVPGATREAASCAWFAIESLQFLGKLTDVAAALPGLRREAARRGDQFLTMILDITAGPLFVDMAADRSDRARDRVEQRIADWGQGPELSAIYRMYALTPLDLYDGDGRAAFDRLDGGWKLARRNHWLRIQITRIHLWLFRALGAVGAIAAGDRDPRLASLIGKTMKLLARQRADYASGYRAMLAVNLAALAGDEATAGAGLAEAEELMERSGLALHAALCRRARGRLLGGDQGRALITASHAFTDRQQIRNPDRLASIWLPALAG